MFAQFFAIQLLQGFVIWAALTTAEEAKPLDPTAIALGAMVLTGSIIGAITTAYVSRQAGAANTAAIVAAVVKAQEDKAAHDEGAALLLRGETVHAADKVAAAAAKTAENPIPVEVVPSSIAIPVEVVASPDNPLPVEVVKREEFKE